MRTLPKEFQFAHDVAVGFHDTIVDIVKEGEANHRFDVTIEFRSEADVVAFKGIGDEPIPDWLVRNGYAEKAMELAAKQISRALLVDFCHFVLEGLRAAAKGKTVVAYALFRKAFKDNLFYLEWILADQVDFFEKFEFGDPAAIDVTKVSETRRIEIINQVIGQSSHPGWADATFMHSLRYSRDHPEGLHRMWDRAVHLITTNKRYTTEPRNFNFIFSGADEIRSHWEHIYYYVPFVLYHAVLVVETMLEKVFHCDWSVNVISDLHRDVGFYLWSKQIGFPRTDGVCVNPKTLVWDLGALSCPNCYRPIQTLDRRRLMRFFKKGRLFCTGCRTDLDLGHLHQLLGSQ